MKVKTKILISYSVIFFIVLFGVGFTLWQFVVLGNFVHDNVSVNADILSNNALLSEYAGSIRYYDEVLTQSARNYAFTGDQKWKTRYLKTAPELDTIIKDAIANGSEKERAFFDSIDSANLALVCLEMRSMGFVDAGDRTGAVSVLESKEYSDLKMVYSNGIADYYRNTADLYKGNLVTLSEKLKDSVASVGASVDHVIASLVLAFFLIIISTFLVLRYSLKQIFGPLQGLKNGIQKIKSGNFVHLEDIGKQNEIGEVVEAFNGMAGEIETFKKNMEGKVAERTKELSQKVEELERWQKMVVGRELEMIKLKEEIQRLKNSN